MTNSILKNRNKVDQDIDTNFSSRKENKVKCIFEQFEDMERMYSCKYSNSEKIYVKDEKI